MNISKSHLIWNTIYKKKHYIELFVLTGVRGRDIYLISPTFPIIIVWINLTHLVLIRHFSSHVINRIRLQLSFNDMWQYNRAVNKMWRKRLWLMMRWWWRSTLWTIWAISSYLNVWTGHMSKEIQIWQRQLLCHSIPNDTSKPLIIIHWVHGWLTERNCGEMSCYFCTRSFQYFGEVANDR